MILNLTKRSNVNSKLFIFLICFLVFSQQVFGQTAPNISYPTNLSFVNNAPISPISPTNTGGSISNDTLTHVSTFLAATNQIKAFTVDKDNNIHTASWNNYGSPGNIITVNKYARTGTLISTISINGIQKPESFVIANDGNYYFSDDRYIKRVSINGYLQTVAGTINSSYNPTDYSALNTSIMPTNLQLGDPGSILFSSGADIKLYYYSGGFAGKIVTLKLGDASYAKYYLGKRFFRPNIPSFTYSILMDGFDNSISFKWENVEKKYRYTQGMNFIGGVMLDFRSHAILSAGRQMLSIAPDGKETNYAGVASGYFDGGSFSSVDGRGSNASFKPVRQMDMDGESNLYALEQDGGLRKVRPNGYYTVPKLPAGLQIDQRTGVISGTPTEIVANKTYKVIAHNEFGTATFNLTFSVVNLPLVSSADAILVTQASASAGGNVIAAGGQPVTARGVCWNTSTAPTIANSKTTDGSGLGNYTSNLTGLSANTIYYVRAYATSSLGTNYGEEKTFSTNLKPVITSNGGTATATINVAENSNAVTTVTSTDGDNPALSQTATYSINGGADAAKFTINSSTGVLGFVTAPDFELPTDADQNNLYEVEVKVIDNGSIPKFSTQAVLVTVTDVTDLASIKPYVKPATTSADLGGDIFVDYANRNNAITERGIVYALTSANSNPIIGGTGVSKIISNEVSNSFIEYTPGLLATTNYTFKAYAINSNGTSYSLPINFTTNSSFSAPTINYSPQPEYGINRPMQLTVVNSGGDIVAGIMKNVTTIAGSGTAGGTDNANLLLAQFNRPSGITKDALGNYYICESADERIRKISATGVLSTVIDRSDNGYSQPLDIVIDSRTGNLYYSVSSGSINRILNTDSVNYPNTSPVYLTTSTDLNTYEFAGTRNSSGYVNSFGRNARFSYPKGIAISPDNSYILVADERNSQVRKVTIPYGDVTTFAGVQDGTDFTTPQTVTNGTVTTAKFIHPFDVAITSDGLTVYVVEAQNGNRIRKITGGNVTSLAGKDNGTYGFVLGDGSGVNASFYNPTGLALDPAGNIYVSEREGVSIRKVTPTGEVTSIAGGSLQSGAVDGVGFNATFNYNNFSSMNFMYFDPSGFLVYPDFSNNKIRKVNMAGYEISHPLPTGLTFNDKNGEIKGTPTENTYKNHYANNFNAGTIGTTVSGGTISLTGTAAILGDHIRLIESITGAPAQTSAITIPTSGTNQKEYRVHFKFTQFMPASNGNRSYLTYSFTDETGFPTSTSERSGAGISIVFDRYASSDNIYLRYGTGGNSYTAPSPANTSWKGKVSTVDIKINTLGQITLLLNGVEVFVNVAANASFVNDDKTNFKHVFKAGVPSGNTDILEIDDIVIQEGVGASEYTITGYNGYGKSEITKTFNVVNAPLTVAYSSSNLNVNNGTIIGNYTPTITGGMPSTYTITPSLSPGLTIHPTTGIISGKPTKANPSTTYLIRASNVSGSATTSVTITVAEVAPTALQFSQAGSFINALTATNGIAIGTITPTTAGGTVVSYSVTPSLPRGLFLDYTTGYITGTPSLNVASATYTFTATNSIGSTSKALNITVNAAAPTNLSYAPVVGSNNSILDIVSPSVNGGTPTSYAISPNPPAGISLNTTYGTIAGTPTAPSALTTYTITATNAAGSTTATTTIVVNDVAPSNLTYNTAKYIGSNGSAITTMYANASGGAITNFSISPSLPTGLIFNTITGTISGTPIAASPLTTYTITASNNIGSATCTINIEVLATVPTISYPNATESLTVGWPLDITPTSLSNGNTSFNLGTFQFSVSPALPAGLSLDPNTGKISGTSTIASSLTTYTITITNGTASRTTTLALELVDASPAGLAYFKKTIMNSDGTTATTFTPSSTGGNISAYAVTPSLPSGITINTTTGVISGTPSSTFALTDYVVTASSGIGSTTSTISLSAATAAPVFNYPNGSLTAAVGVAITSVAPNISNSTTATYNIGATTFTIAPALPAGLSLNAATGEIYGTPTLTSPVTKYVITATNGSDITTSELNIQIAGLPTIASTTTVSSIGKNDAISGGNISNDGGLAITQRGIWWSLNTNPTVSDNGIIDQGTTGVFVSNMAGLAANTTYYVRAYATNSAGTSYGNEISFKTLPAISYNTSNSFVRGIASTILPSISGTNTLSFTSTPLPAGLTINTTTGVISGTATAVQAATTYTVTATNLDGGSSSFNISIAITSSDNANLGMLALSTGTLSAVFSSSTLNYTSNVNYGTSTITLTPTLNDANATVKVNGNTVANGSASAAINLSIGANTINIVVTAEDGTSTKTYTVIVTRAAASVDATLSGFVLSVGTLSPSFNSNTFSYTSSVGMGTNSVTITPAGTNGQATITVNGIALTNGSATINLVTGTNTITVNVTAENGTSTKTYTVVITKSATISNDASLSGVALSVGTLSPSFNTNTFNYTASVVTGTNTVTITPAGTNGQATITVNGTALTNGAATVNLVTGTNTITVNVTAENGTSSKTYTVVVTKAASVDATLSGFALNVGTLSPSFNANTYNYTSSVGAGTSTVTITPSGTNGQATITVNGAALTNGAATVNLVTGTNTITVAVTAEDGTSTKTYTVVITKSATISNDASLSGVALSVGTLSPSFNTNTFNYTANVGAGTNSVTISPAGTNGQATITVNGASLTNGAATVNLVTGTNTITISVTAEDGTSTKTYTVIVTRAAPPTLSSDASLSGVALSVGTLSPIFNTNTFNYTASVGAGTSSVTISSAGTNGQATITVNGASLTNGVATVNLVIGTNTITVAVTAENGTSTKTYTIIVTRAAVPPPLNGNVDTDGDGVPDTVEVSDGTNPNNPSDAKDSDGDGVPDYIEINDGTDPNKAGDTKDTDGDGMADYFEVKNGYDPLVNDVPVDTDHDGVPDQIEITQGTNPNNPSDAKDTDLDGVPDYIELKQGTNPLNAADAKDLFGAPVVKYSNMPSVITSGVNFNISPVVSGVAINKYKISPDLPTGLKFDTTNGVISGIPSLAKKMTTYVVTATNIVGSRKSTFTLSVIPVLKPISGPVVICGAAQTIKLLNEVAGGVWSSNKPSVVTIDANGRVTGVGSVTDSVKITYTLTVDSSSNAVNQTIYYYPSAPISKRLEYQNIVLNSPTILNARSGGIKYEWIPSGMLDNPNLISPKAILNAATEFTIKVTMSNGCVAVDTLPTRVFYEPGMHIPNVFTPNGDGMNDLLKLNFVELSELKFFKVYDRYNRLVYETKQLVSTWDGTYLGRQLPSDTYYWVFSAVDIHGNSINKTGPILIIK